LDCCKLAVLILPVEDWTEEAKLLPVACDSPVWLPDALSAPGDPLAVCEMAVELLGMGLEVEACDSPVLMPEAGGVPEHPLAVCKMAAELLGMELAGIVACDSLVLLPEADCVPEDPFIVCELFAGLLGVELAVDGCLGAAYVPLPLAVLGRNPEEGAALRKEEEWDMDEFEPLGPQGPVLTIVAFVPPVVPSLMRSISSQKSLRMIFWICETMMLV
jgi:hypothetical protein